MNLSAPQRIAFSPVQHRFQVGIYNTNLREQNVYSFLCGIHFGNCVSFSALVIEDMCVSTADSRDLIMGLCYLNNKKNCQQQKKKYVLLIHFPILSSFHTTHGKTHQVDSLRLGISSIIGNAFFSTLSPKGTQYVSPIRQPRPNFVAYLATIFRFFRSRITFTLS